jgi:predicted esterase
MHLPAMTPDQERHASTHHIAVRRTARYAMLGEPGTHIRDVWIVCHGHAQLARKFIERFRGIVAADRLIVAPEGLNRYYIDGGFHGPASRVGATWMTTEDRENEIADYVAYLDALSAEIFRTVPRVHATLRVLGFSQGVATAARWVSAGNTPANEVILWAGSLPTELTRAGAAHLTASGRRPLIVAGNRDEYITPKVVAQQVGLLRGLGVTAEVTTYDGGHEIDAPTLSAIARAG